jgi:S1-C subfamily serine protease
MSFAKALFKMTLGLIIIGMLTSCSIRKTVMISTMKDQFNDQYIKISKNKIDDTCIIGAFIDKDNTIKQLTAYSIANGLQVDDKIIIINDDNIVNSKQRKDKFLTINDIAIDIEANAIEDNEIRKDRLKKIYSNETIKIEVKRNDGNKEVTMNCKGRRDLTDKILDGLKAGAQGNWRKCISSTYDIDTNYGKIYQIAEAKCACYLAEVLENDRMLDSYAAQLVYESKRQKIQQMVWNNQDLETIRAEIINIIASLEKQKSYSYASDLQRLWDESTHPSVVRAPKPPEMIESKPPQKIISSPPEKIESIKAVGTCFVASSKGHILTAQHVIDGSSTIKIKLSGDDKFYDAKVLQVSKSNDIALLKIDANTPNWLHMISTKTISSGTQIFTMGYPVQQLLGEEPKFNDGSVSSMSGLSGEATYMQISVPIQPGNSGGPVVTFDGSVIGIVTSTAAVKPFLSFTGSLPQNINWAIKSDYAMVMLDQPYKVTKSTTRENVIDEVKKSICFIESIIEK